MRCNMTQYWIIHAQDQEYEVVYLTQCKHMYGWNNCIDRFIQTVEQINIIYIVTVKVWLEGYISHGENAISNKIIFIYIPPRLYINFITCNEVCWNTMNHWIVLHDMYIIILTIQQLPPGLTYTGIVLGSWPTVLIALQFGQLGCSIL